MIPQEPIISYELICKISHCPFARRNNRETAKRPKSFPTIPFVFSLMPTSQHPSTPYPPPPPILFSFHKTSCRLLIISEAKIQNPIFKLGFIISLTRVEWGNRPGAWHSEAGQCSFSFFLLCPHQALLCLNPCSPPGSRCQSGIRCTGPWEGRDVLDALSVSFNPRACFCRRSS